MDVENFFGENYHFVWSDNWCMDGDEIWFMAGAMDVLFCMNGKTMEASVVGNIPLDRICAFRQHPICIKQGNIVFCLPDNGEDIWSYNVSDCSWTRIPVENFKGVRRSCSKAWFIQDKLYILSLGLKQIIEVDVNREKNNHYYDLLCGNEGNISGSILVDGCIYVVGSSPAAVYKFNCTNKKVETFLLSGMKGLINTICYDGDKFWLSGQRREVYIWREGEREVTVLDRFPNNFGVYNFSGKYEQLLNCSQAFFDIPLFITSVFAGSYVWMIPFQANEILYIDRDTLEIKIFPLAYEMQTEENVKTQLLGHKYLLEYVREERYIGLFSLKNKWVVEIDSQKLEYKVLDCRIDEDSSSRISGCILADMFKRRSIMNEKEQLGIHDLMSSLLPWNRNKKNFKETGNIESDTMGKRIYYNLR